MLKSTKRFSIYLIILLWFIPHADLLGQDTLRVMYYNILNYPGSTPERVSNFKTINLYIQPDILLVNELQSDDGAIMLLEDGLNVYGTYSFKKADFTDGTDSDNMLFYDSAKVTLYSQDIIPTELRLINEYVLYINEPADDTIFFYMYSAHLKSSTGSVNEQKRLGEVREFKAWIDNKPEIENIFFGGDFNFYDASEPAYDTLTNYGVRMLNDPLPAGNWHDNSSYASIHTQSTRTDQFGGGATGGVDDRFDFILYSDDVVIGTNGVNYIPNSCKPIGNDGNHFNIAIIDPPTNTSVPDSVLQALYNMSDHMPVICDLQTNLGTYQDESLRSNTGIEIFPNPASESFTVKFNGFSGRVKVNMINNLGVVVKKKEVSTDGNVYQTKFDVAGLQSGVYYLRVVCENSQAIKKVIVY